MYDSDKTDSNGNQLPRYFDNAKIRPLPRQGCKQRLREQWAILSDRGGMKKIGPSGSLQNRNRIRLAGEHAVGGARAGWTGTLRCG